jgi:hypothetical protein
MSIQYIIDRAQSIEVDRKRLVGQTMSRSQRIKTAERNTAQPWRFSVSPPGVLLWNQARAAVEDIASGDRIQEYTVGFTRPGHNFIAGYQGAYTQAQLNPITISQVGVNTLTLTNLPANGQVIKTEVRRVRATNFSLLRNDFLIPTQDYIAPPSPIAVGDRVFHPQYVSGSATNPIIQDITVNYSLIDGVSYTRITMGGPATANSPVQETVTIDVSRDILSSEQTVLFKKGDFIQPANSRYPYSITEDVLRGTGSRVVSLNRSIITSEAINLVGQQIRIGSLCTWRVVVVGLPTYTFIQQNQIQFNGNFDLVERII